jgi:hypothetical protein
VPRRAHPAVTIDIISFSSNLIVQPIPKPQFQLTDMTSRRRGSAPTRRFETTGRDLPQRTGARRVMTETIPINKQTGLPPGSVHSQMIMSAMNRRALVAAILPAIAIPAAAQCVLAPDPVFAAIANHRLAAAAELRARHDRDAMEETLPEELQHPPVPDCGPLPLLGVK